MLKVNEPREPVQQRSIEKKNNIIKSALELFCTKGYYNTNTAEIAKHAKVSTGIVYSYFVDKKDLFVHSIKLFIEGSKQLIQKILDNFDNTCDIKQAIDGLINVFSHSYTSSKKAHEEIEAVKLLDEEVTRCFAEYKHDLISMFATKFEEVGLTPPNVHERMHIIYDVLESLMHEIAYSYCSHINIDIMKDVATETIYYLLTNYKK